VMMVVAAMVPAGALQRVLHLIEADAAVAVLVELAEHLVGRRDIGAAGTERALEFRFADLAITIAVDQREQILQRILRRAG